MSNSAKNIFLAAFLLAVLGISVWLIFGRGGDAKAGELDQFAMCLAEKGAVMYGADWCGHCQNEKRAFGDSFRLVTYVECPENTAMCIEKGIKGYPTWILGDGTRLEGEQGIQKLSEATGCLP